MGRRVASRLLEGLKDLSGETEHAARTVSTVLADISVDDKRTIAPTAALTRLSQLEKKSRAKMAQSFLDIYRIPPIPSRGSIRWRMAARQMSTTKSFSR